MTYPLKNRLPGQQQFEYAVAKKFKKASVESLFKWFDRDETGAYTRIEIQEMWKGWLLHIEWAKGDL